MSREEALHTFAGAYISGVHNTSSSQEWGSAFMNKYAGAYKQYPNFKEQSLNCSQPAECKTIQDLKAWRDDLHSKHVKILKKQRAKVLKTKLKKRIALAIKRKNKKKAKVGSSAAEPSAAEASSAEAFDGLFVHLLTMKSFMSWYCTMRCWLGQTI